MPNTKEEIKVFVEKVKYELEGGYIDPLKALRDVRAIQTALEQIADIAKPLALAEAEKYGKRFELMGAKFEIKEVGVKYNYENCNDLKYATLKDSEKKIKEDLKTRDGFLKAIKEKEIIVDDDTGETITVYPPIKSSTTSVVITL